MSPELFRLVEAVRALQLSATGLEGPKSVRFGIDIAEIPERLLDVVRALEAVDARGGVGAAASDDAVQLRKGLDALIRWVAMRGHGLDAPMEVVAEAMGGQSAAKKASGYVTLPVFAPNGWKKKKKWKPRLVAGAVAIGEAYGSLAEHRKVGQMMDQTALKMGAVLPPLPDDNESGPAPGGAP